MLTLVIPGTEMFDEEKQEFFTIDDRTLEFEHSLVSLSKWEAKHQKPFLSTIEKSTDEVFDYLMCMCLTPNVPEVIFQQLTAEDLLKINDYIDAKMTATWFSDSGNSKPSREIVTAELIYYWMISFRIPIECEHWHLARLFTLIRVFDLKSSKPKKMTRAELAQRNRELNAKRKKQLNTAG